MNIKWSQYLTFSPLDRIVGILSIKGQHAPACFTPEERPQNTQWNGG